MEERERFGRYTLLRRLAVGGMGELFLADRDGIAGFSKQVVVKRIRSDLAHDEEFVEMFLNEGRLAALLNHPNIVHIYELGQHDERYFMAMEYVPGQNLEDVLEVLPGPLPLPIAIYVMTQLCEGLAFAHDAKDNSGRPLGLVHRDISPPNVLISYSGEVKLTDFGIAKVQQSKQTRAGVLKGKFAYLSPEQAMGEPIDRRSDVYALGLVLFEATIGAKANPGSAEVEQIYAASQGRVLQPSLERPDYPPDLERIFLRATALAPRDRYQTVRELHRDLTDLQARHRLIVTPAEVGAYIERTFAEQDEAPTVAPGDDGPTLSTDTDPVPGGGDDFLGGEPADHDALDDPDLAAFDDDTAHGFGHDAAPFASDDSLIAQDYDGPTELQRSPRPITSAPSTTEDDFYDEDAETRVATPSFPQIPVEGLDLEALDLRDTDERWTPHPDSGEPPLRPLDTRSKGRVAWLMVAGLGIGLFIAIFATIVLFAECSAGERLGRAPGAAVELEARR